MDADVCGPFSRFRQERGRNLKRKEPVIPERREMKQEFCFPLFQHRISQAEPAVHFHKRPVKKTVMSSADHERFMGAVCAEILDFYLACRLFKRVHFPWEIEK